MAIHSPSLSIGAKKGKVKGYALIRDKEGKPKIDDVKNCPPELWALLTDIEKEELLNGTHT